MKSLTLAGIAALTLLVPAMAAAQVETVVVKTETQTERSRTGVGARAFLGLTPDQFGIGAQARFGNAAGGHWAPSVDFGFGDNRTTTAINGDVVWNVPLPGSTTAFYLGGGPALTYWSYDAPGLDSDLEIGLNAVFGMTLPMGRSNHYNFELRYGIGDVPELRLAAGILIGS